MATEEKTGVQHIDVKNGKMKNTVKNNKVK